MKTLFITGITALLIACGSGGGSGSSDDVTSDETVQPVCSNYKYLGMYGIAAMSYWDHIEETADYTNFAQIYCWGNNPETIPLIKKAIDNGLKIQIYADARAWFLDYDGDRRAAINQTGWDMFVEAIRPYEKHIIGFYMTDEPYLSGVSLSDQEFIIAYYKQAFPTIPTWATYAPTKRGKKIPENLDIIGLTPWYDAESPEDYRFAVKKMLKHLPEHQSVVLILDGYSGRNQTDYAYQTKKAQNLYKTYQLSCGDPRVVGLFTYTYHDPSRGLGVESLEIIEDELRKIYDEIMR